MPESIAALALERSSFGFVPIYFLIRHATHGENLEANNEACFREAKMAIFRVLWRLPKSLCSTNSLAST
jgi:hypothetical protein